MQVPIYSIRWKNFFIFIIIFLSFAYCLLYFVQKTMMQELENKAVIPAMYRVGEVAKEIDRYFEQMSNVYLNIVADVKLVEELSLPPEDNKYSYIINKFNTLISSYKNIYSLYIYDMKNDVFISSNGGKTLLINDTWVNEAKGNGGKKKLAYISNAEMTYTLPLISFVGTARRDFFYEDVACISVNALKLFMKEAINPPKTQEDTLQFVLDGDNQLVFGDIPGNLTPIVENFWNDSGYFHMLVHDIKYIIIYGISDKMKWKFVQMIPEKEMFSGIRQIKTVFNYIFVIFTLIGLLLSFIVSNQFTRPIYSLVEMMKKYRNQEENYKAIRINRKDEFHYLYAGFSNMIQRVDHLIDQVYKANLYKKDMELRKIQESINPHFIYNILDSVIWILKFGKCEKGIHVLETFSMYLRNTLHKNRDFITVEETRQELAAYCELQKFFSDDRIDYSIDFEDNIHKCPIMSLLIQPVVENSYVHAFKNMDGNGIIEISGRKYNDALVFYIKDNGKGMAPDEIATLYEKMEAFDIEPGNRFFGLGSVHQRIKLVYGAEYGITVKSEINKGTEVAITIPVERKEDRAETG